MKKLILILIISISLFSCDSKRTSTQEDVTKFFITVDDGNRQGLLSITKYKALDYTRYDDGGVKFTTTDGKEHFTTHKVSIREK